MKKIFILLSLALPLAVVSCEKPDSQEEGKAAGEIVLSVDGSFGVSVDTKATALTALPSTLYWGATTGSTTEALKWAAASTAHSSGKITTGKFQTLVPTAYNYYVASQTFTVGAETTMTVANNNTDVVAGRTAASSSTAPSVALEHIFARTGSVTVNPPSGYTISGVSMTIVGKGTSGTHGTAGTYNLRTGAWTPTTRLNTAQALTSSSDLYLIPGTYTVTFNYTLTRGDFVKSYSKTADVTLAKGKINNITANAGDTEASPIVVNVSLTAWAANGITVNL